MPELSIIVPVYKVEPYLSKCIESILAQTFTDFELILIDDGSPDRCGEICDEYAAKDDRIIVIHQKNQGVSVARNAGLDIARGKYIGFVDSDDWIEPEMYMSMTETARVSGADVVICGCSLWREDGTRICADLTSEGSYDSEQMLQAIYGIRNPLGGVLWNKLFRFEPIRDVRFRSHMRNCEDGVFIALSFFRYNYAVKRPETYYNVLQREFSASRSNNIPQVYHTVQGFVEFRGLLKEHRHGSAVERASLDMLLNNCVRFGRIIQKLHRENGTPCEEELKGIRKIMRPCIFEAIRKKAMPINKIHGYIRELRKLHV